MGQQSQFIHPCIVRLTDQNETKTKRRAFKKLSVLFKPSSYLARMRILSFIWQPVAINRSPDLLDPFFPYLLSLRQVLC